MCHKHLLASSVFETYLQSVVSLLRSVFVVLLSTEPPDLILLGAYLISCLDVSHKYLQSPCSNDMEYNHFQAFFEGAHQTISKAERHQASLQ